MLKDKKSALNLVLNSKLWSAVKIYISSATPDCFRSDWNR